MVQFLADRDVNPKLVDVHAQTALFYASRNGYPSVCQWLMNHGCKAGQEDNS